MLFMSQFPFYVSELLNFNLTVSFYTSEDIRRMSITSIIELF